MTRSPAFALPPDVEEAVALLETSEDRAAGDEAFWRVQRFQNGFGVRLAAPSIAFSVLAMIIALAVGRIGLTNPIAIALIAATGAVIAAFLLLNHRRRKAEREAFTRITAALRRWRALAQASAQKDPA